MKTAIQSWTTTAIIFCLSSLLCGDAFAGILSSYSPATAFHTNDLYLMDSNTTGTTFQTHTITGAVLQQGIGAGLVLTNGAVINSALSNVTINGSTIVAGTNGGLGMANSNSVPAGAHYSAGNDPNTGQPFFFAHVTPGLPYFAVFTNSNDNLITWNTNSSDPNFSITATISGTGFFVPTNQWVYLVGTTQSSLVGVVIYPSNSPIAGNFLGAATLNLTPLSTVPDGALSNDVVTSGTPLNIFPTASSSLESFICSSNNTTGGGNGSTLTIAHMGTLGYADLNFRTQGYNPANYNNKTQYALQFAIGAMDPSATTLFPYAAGPYIELYNPAVQSLFFVHYGYGYASGNPGFIGGVRSNAFFWSQDGSTNKDAFVVYPVGAGAGAAGITNYLNVTAVSNSSLNTVTANTVTVSNLTTSTHYAGRGTSPTIVTNSGAGGGSGTVTLDSTASDSSGLITLTMGSSAATSATVFTLTFNAAYATAPHVILTPANANAANLQPAQVLYAQSTTGGFTASSGSSGLVSGGTIYKWFYKVEQ